MKYDIQTSKGIVSFDHIRDFYNFDKIQRRRCAPKLTDRHIYAEGLSSMNVNLAAQVFSNSVAAGMSLCIMAGTVKAAAAATIDFVGLFNDLFDSVNGTSIKPSYGKKYHCAVQTSSPHIPFWSDIIKEISSWKLLTKDLVGIHSKKRKIATPPCFSGWQISLKSLILLYSDLKELSFKFLLTRRLNQDCLENLFSRIRGTGGNRTNPTAFELQSSFKFVCINSWTQHHKFSNCEDDKDLIECPEEMNLRNHMEEHRDDESYFENDLVFNELQQSSFLKDIESCEDKVELCNNETDSSELFLEKNILMYLAGYVARRILQCIHCETCINLLTDRGKSLTNETLFLNFKEYNQNGNNSFGLVHPSKDFLNCFSKCVYLSDIILYDTLFKTNVLYKLRSIFEDRVNFSFLSACEEHHDQVKKKMINITCKLCLKIYLREINKVIEKKIINIKPFRDQIKLKAMEKINNLK